MWTGSRKGFCYPRDIIPRTETEDQSRNRVPVTALLCPPPMVEIKGRGTEGADDLQ
jgi:hypothetical protein